MRSTIEDIAVKYHQLPMVYIIRLPKIIVDDDEYNSVYKFGTTCDIGNQLKKHLKNLKFVDIIIIKSFNNLGKTKLVENHIKKCAKTNNELINILGITELITSYNIFKYIDIVYSGHSMAIKPNKQVRYDNIMEVEHTTEPAVRSKKQ